MRKGIDYPFQMTGFFAFGLVLVVVVIVVFFMPSMLYAAYGQCWGDSYTSLQDMKSTISYLTIDQSKTARMSIGNCVGGVVIFEKDYFDTSATEFGRFVSQLEEEYCTKYTGYKSYILMIPWKTVKEEETKKDAGWLTKISGKWKEYYDYAKRLWSSKGREALIKPSCFGIEGGVLSDKGGNRVIYIPSNLAEGPQNLNEKDLKFCYSFSKISSTSKDGFEYRMELAADSQCPDKK